jgi:protein involved in temperature-dependent protein secretion
MTIDQRMQQGDWEGALALVTQETSGPSPDPGQLLVAFNLEVRLQRFDAAAATMRRLLAIAPQVAEPMSALGRTARAEAAATARTGDPAAAGKRAALGVPPPHAFAFVKAAVCHAQQDHAGAAAALAEAHSPAVAGTLTWRSGKTARFVDLVDSDDLTGPILPCYDADKVLDLPYSQLRSVTFLDGKMSFDVMWIPAEITPVTGKPFAVKVPAFYIGTGVAQMPMVRTGQTTMWDRAHGYAEAIGQRDLKVATAEGGNLMVGILQIRRIELDAKPEADKPKGFWKRLVS